MPVYYSLTLFTCAVTAIILSLVLLGVTIRQDESLKKYRSARWCLCAAFIAYGIANMFQAGMEYDGKQEALTGVMMIFIGSVQAVMFTMLALIFIRPSIVTVRRVLLQLSVVFLVSAFLFMARFTFPLSAFYVVYYVCILGYVALMAAYTWLFVRSYKVFQKQMMDFYEEEELLYRMRWIKWTFWSALAVGVLALLLIIDNHMVNVLLTLLFTAYFLFVTVSFINYQQYAQLIVRAYESEPHVSQQSVEKEKMSPAEVEKIRAGISEWVREKKYVESDHSVEEIARQLAQLCGRGLPHLAHWHAHRRGETPHRREPVDKDKRCCQPHRLQRPPLFLPHLYEDDRNVGDRIQEWRGAYNKKERIIPVSGLSFHIYIDFLTVRKAKFVTCL